MQRIAILGSTGSIGLNALEVARQFPDRFKVEALSTNSNTQALEQQIREFKPSFCCVADKKAAGKIKLPLRNTKLFSGIEGLNELASNSRIDKVLIAISGYPALEPLLAAIKSSKTIALANKEALVAAGGMIMKEADRHKAKVIPIDSEQSAIWQCLDGNDIASLKNIYLTASGGPFRKIKQNALKSISVAQVLKHPRWKMGRKITVDSATLMNKGLELLEAMFLFGAKKEKIKIIIHPEAIIHSMVEFIDGVILAQLSATDMRIPIQYAFTYPERLGNHYPGIDFYKLGKLNFERPDLKKFPCLALALRAAEELGTLPVVLNAANEVSVENFLKRRISFLQIPKIIERTMDGHVKNPDPGLPEIKEADSWARRKAQNIIATFN